MNRLAGKSLILAGSVLLVAGCSWLAGPEDDVIGATLDDLEPAQLPEEDSEVPAITLADIEQSYHRALDVASDDEVRRKILVRLAGLEMIRSEQNQVEANAPGDYFTDTIVMYQELIALQAGRPGEDKLLYQLAKAYALDGRTAESRATLDRLAASHPDSPYISETQFRLAEQAFSAGNYAAAEAGYARVVAAGETTGFQGDFQNAFQDNARYMLGWSQFKRDRYEESLMTFTRVLDDTMGESAELADVPRAKQNLVADTFRVMGVIFSYRDGPDTIYQTYQNLGVRPYNHLFYRNLGDLYLDKERYRDSADTYQFYVDHYPLSDYAPQFSGLVIDVYDQGDFPSLLLPAKEEFVNNYGIRSQYWEQKPKSVRESLKPDLHTYIDELAGYEHAQAQSLKASLNEGDSQTAMLAGYQRAARWYEEFELTFPDDPKTPEMVFLLGESRYESGQLAQAVTAYEKVAYQYLDPQYGAEAGYSAILALDELASRAAQTAPPEQQSQQEPSPQELSPQLSPEERWLDHKTDSAISFADYYPDDERAPGVLAQAAQTLLQKGEHQQAVAAATRLTQWDPPLPVPLQKTAWLVIGQAQFDLGQYAESETAYRQVLAMMPPPGSPGQEPLQGPSRAAVVDRIAASMYKQVEQSLTAEDKTAAITQLLAIKEVAPGSDIAATAEYDAATYLMEQERWREAEDVLLDFRRSYPAHPLGNTIAPKLVLIYQTLEMWQPAAEELAIMASSDSDPEVRRQSLYLSAELYEQSGNRDAAIDTYAQYTETYPQPFDQLIEAQNKLVELNTEAGNQRERRLWLNQLIITDANAGAARSNRSKSLAAMAAAEFADEDYREFAAIPLTLPLKQSLDRKRAALDRTLKAYEKVLDYGIEEYSTLASYRIGEIYTQLSRDLLESERPNDLDALASEQYTILLEEQAFPFEEQAIDIHEANVRRTREGVYDNWVKQSFSSLAKLLPARYAKQESVVEYSNAIH